MHSSQTQNIHKKRQDSSFCLGSSSGIGAAIAELFAARGAKVTICGRNEKTLNETKAACIKAGSSENAVMAMPGDVVDESYLKCLVDQTVVKFGKLDILVNNAGIMPNHQFEDDLSETYDKIMNVNVRSVIRLTQLSMPHLKEAKGNVVNVSSVGSMCHSGLNMYYGMSKSALDQFTMTLANILGPTGVRINSVNPGVVRTNIVRDEGVPKEQVDMVFDLAGKVHALRRIGHPYEVAEAVAFLASDAASFSTGELLVVDGGRRLMLKPLVEQE